MTQIAELGRGRLDNRGFHQAASQNGHREAGIAHSLELKTPGFPSQEVLDAVSIELPTFFTSHSSRESGINEWSGYQSVSGFYQLPLARALNGSGEFFPGTVNRMAIDWGETDKEYNRETQKGTLYKKGREITVARIDAENGVVEVAVSGNVKSSLQTIKEVLKALELAFAQEVSTNKGNR